MLYKHNIKQRFTVAVDPNWSITTLQPGDSGTLLFGLSRCHKRDVFTRKLGREFAKVDVGECDVKLVKKEITEFTTVCVLELNYHDNMMFKVVLHYNNYQGSVYLGCVKKL